MPVNPNPAAPQITAEHFEAALAVRHAPAPGAEGRMAFNPAKFVEKAAKLARLTPAILAALSASGVPIPVSIGAIVQLVVTVADAFDGDPKPA